MKAKATTFFIIAALLATTGSAFAAHPEHLPPPPASIERANRPVGAIPHRDWHRGDRLPAEYRDRIFMVENLRQHGLQTPPRGYHWVGVAGDYVLVATATGVIANVLSANAR